MKSKLFSYYFSIFILVSLFVVTSCQPKSTPTEQPVIEIETTTNTPSSTETAPNSPIAVTKNIFLDPAITQDKDSLMISGYLYEGLVIVDANGEPQPGIAESWVPSDDQLDYIFTLRPDATFSDGTPITPDIVVNNFNRWLDPENSLHGDAEYTAWQNTFLGFLGEKDENNRTKSIVDGVQKVDSNTVILHLSRLEPEVLTYLANPAFAILNTNSLALGGYGKQGSAVISSGAYLVSSWTEDGLVLSPNQKYWGEIPTGDLNFIWK